METKIHVLPDEVVSRIAAGEVVERPSSVLKELVENSLDAGARRVDVEIGGGGRDLIRVTDDGSGMTPEDLALCCLPHATSKLSSADDLNGLSTLGFRGEALPSIASVSKFSLTSRMRSSPQDGGSAWRIVVSGAQPERPQPSPAAGPYGTTVEIRDLFFNVPARAKFLKGLAVEGAACIDTLLRLALTRPDVAFVLSQERHEIFSCLPFGNPASPPAAGLVAPKLPAEAYFQRARTVLGRSSSEGLLEVAFDEPSGLSGYRLYGLLSPPSITRPTRAGIYLNVNGRPVKDRTLTSALLNAYRNLLPGKRFPIAVLYLELPPADVDVNVHPAKAEVRFRLPGLIYALLQNAVREATRGAEPQTNAGVLQPLANADVMPSSGNASNSPASKPAGLDLWPRAQPAPSAPEVQPAPAGKAASHSYTPANLRSGNVAEPAAAFAEALSPALRKPAPQPISFKNKEEFQARTSAKTGEEFFGHSAPAAAAPFRVLGQAGGRYIVVEDERGVKIIDQHALHERILFETFMRQSESQARGDAQGLLIAETLELSPVEAAIFPEAEDVLAKLGFEIETFGPRALVVRAVPAILKTGTAALVRDVLDALACGDETAPGARKSSERSYYREKTAFTVACKGALKAGERLTVEQMAALVAEYRKCAGSPGFTCPHGRPVALELSWADLERAVKR